MPEEGEAKWAVKRLRNNRAGGTLRMKAEELKGWLAAARRGEKKRENTEKEGGDRQEGQHQSAVLYVNDSMVVLSDPAWL